MTVHVTIELGQGRVDDVRVHRREADAHQAEQAWLKQRTIASEEDRHCHEMNGNQFLIFACDLED